MGFRRYGRGLRFGVTQVLALVGVAGGLFLHGGCGRDEPPAAPPGSPSNPNQKGLKGFDAGTQDAGAGEADAGHTIRTGDQVLCSYQEADLFAFAGGAEGGGLAVAADGRGFAMVFEGGAGEFFARAVPLSGTADEAVRIAGPDVHIAEPLLAVAGGDFLLAFRDREDDRLFVRSLVSGDASPQLRSDQVATDDHGGVLVALAARGAGFLLAFVDGEGVLQLRQLDAAGGIDRAESHEDMFERAPRDLHLGFFEDGHALVSWSAEDAEGVPVLMGRMLDPELVFRGAAFPLSSIEPDGSRFGFAVHGQSAGVIYGAVEGGVRDAIKFQRAERDGTTSGPLLNIVNGPRRSRDGAIASFGQGYVVSHRVLTSRGEAQERIEVAFVNQFGSIVYRGTVGDTSERGGPTVVAATQDGHVLTAWSTVARDGTATTHAAKLYCPGALILCGGTL